MSKLILYGTLRSPPVRAVLLTLHALDLEFEFKEIDVQGGETRTDEYLKKNPQHTVPLLEDEDFCIWDSHAINAYLVRKFGKTDSLYPKDLQRRAVVDQRLHFDSGVLGGATKAFMSPHLSKERKLEIVDEAYVFLEAFLEDTYIAGPELTIADLSLLSNVSTLNTVVPISAETRPRLHAWLELLKQLPYYEEANGKGLKLLIERVKELMAEGKI